MNGEKEYESETKPKTNRGGEREIEGETQKYM